MPSTYTTNLNIEKPATGEQVDTWGDTANANYDLIDAAFLGSLDTMKAKKNFIFTNTLALSAVSSADQTRTVDVAAGRFQTVTANQSFYLACTGPANDYAEAYIEVTNSTSSNINLNFDSTSFANYNFELNSIALQGDALGRSHLFRVVWTGSQGWYVQEGAQTRSP